MTAPAMAEMDGQDMQDTELALNDAADDVAPTAEEEESLLELALFHVLGDLERTHAWIALIEAHSALGTEEIRALADRA